MSIENTEATTPALDGGDEAGDLQAQLEQAETALAETKAALVRTERMRAIDAALLEAGVVDLETARLVAERAMTDETEPAEVVRSLAERKPFLFKPRGMTPLRSPSAMSARTERRGVGLTGAAESAMSTGRRTDLLHYMRLKRNGSHRIPA
ncbi:MAG: hypothetical protein KAS72_15690 [Phycisphaerales bacterium]|nr:hypothetical protein [Phycisphaerales bacterium]